ncbi:spheroidene monooxygenase [Longimicrobium terrae]|uniref:Heme-degrading monooxygenase HmoA n=1 Tax=Longimicrobium terrae TaxID=1639882 RepID=A0A841H8B9_9BACT|nr:spheroidene monooxygenase [Longimicrobium terrae]MBB4639680.1 heme-degrading monooxygenase HmoA [Longimicrobium terrae]MBB6074076.1 heme-degrading monooxygenase HmoA [Longimicrobium terrae]
MSLLATFTAVRYTPRRAGWGALHMATQRPLLARTPGLRFARLMGSGAGIGFSAVPDPLLWTLFAVWEDEAHWESFRDGSAVMRQYAARGEERYTLRLRPLSAHGRWGGEAPFGEPSLKAAADEPVVVLTRASIRLSRAARFWSRVHPVDETLRGNADLLLTFGVGEVPWLRQATLSVWRSAEAMRAWAYRTPEHAEVVRRTRAEGWYSEELFTRFRLLGTEGTLHGADPLASLGTPDP